MVDLTRLNVSLTKYGAHKIFQIMLNHDPKDVQSHTDDDVLDIHIDPAQVRKNMSISQSGVVPEYWTKAKAAGEEVLKALVVCAIIHSHHQLIEALSQSKPRLGAGIVIRGRAVDEKVYTNIASVFDKLGYATQHEMQYFEYDLSSVLSLSAFPSLFSEMLKDKLYTAGLEGNEDFLDIATGLGLNDVFGLTKTEYRSWLRTGTLEVDSEENDPVVDSDPPDSSDTLDFVPGHVTRQTSDLTIDGGRTEYRVSQVHNKIQNSLHQHLSQLFGDEAVGTEQSIGTANRVDAVLKTNTDTVFYEIKTSKSARTAIRQAIPQLLEYAYFPENFRASKLVIVAPAKLDVEAAAYMRFLREKLSLPVWYQFFDSTTGGFGEES